MCECFVMDHYINYRYKGMKTFLRWGIGALMIVAGLTVMFAGVSSFFGGLFFIAAGLICLPPVLPIIEGKLGRKISGLAQLGIVVGFILLGNLLSKDGFGAMQESNKLASTKAKDEGEQKESAPVETQEDIDAKLKKQLEVDLLSERFSDGLDMKEYGGSTEAAYSALRLFKAYASRIELGEQSENKENKKLAAELKKKLATLQKKSFPQLRKAFAEAAKEKLWEENIDVTISGSANTVITLTGGIYANNKNIKQSQESMSETLHAFRFKQCHFKWFKHDDEHTYYNIESPPDMEIVAN